MITEGHTAIKAEVLASELKVSKGSFYWHFDKSPTFKNAMLQHWVALGTESIIVEIADRETESNEQLRLLIDTHCHCRHQCALWRLTR